MRNTIISAIIIAVLALGIFFLWAKSKQTNSPKLPAKTAQTATLTPTPTPVSQIQGIKNAPATGVNLILPLLGSVGLSLTGWYCLKKT